jgi:hypothetical protein
VVLLLTRWSSDDEAAPVLLAGHPDGRVREAALPGLARRATPASIGMLVVRCDDWVPQVAGAAQALLRETVERGGAAVLLPALSLLEQLATARTRSPTFARELLALVARDVPTVVLTDTLRSPDRRLRRSVARLIATKADAAQALDVAFGQDDPLTLSIVARAACGRERSEALAERLWRAPAARVRALALERLLAGGSATAAAERALLDPSAPVRWLAQAHLTRHGVDVAARYAAALGAPPVRARVEAALRGLAETHAALHAPLVASFRRHRSARVRETVCRTLEALGATGERDTLFALADDPSRRVARRAGLALVKPALAGPDVERLWAASLRRRDSALWPALVGLDRWLLLALACRGSLARDATANEHGRFFAEHVVRTWNSSFRPPPPALRQELAESLPRALRGFEAGTARELGFVLRPFFVDLT